MKKHIPIILAAFQATYAMAEISINDTTIKTVAEIAAENPGMTLSDIVFGGVSTDPIKAFLTADSDFTFDQLAQNRHMRTVMYRGGGIKATSGAAFVFENSVGDATPGALYNTLGSTFEIKTQDAGSSVIFRNNQTNFRGGAIENIGIMKIAGADGARVVFNGNSVVNAGTGSGALGGAIYNGNDASGASMTVEYADFIGNFTSANSLTSAGGAIYSDTSNLSLNHVNFTGNYADAGTGGVANGGAVAFSDQSDLDATFSVSNSNFSGNYAIGGNGADGGAIGTSVYGRNLNIVSSTFENNRVESGSVTARGGAIYNTQGKSTTVKSSSFTGNSATGTSTGYAYGGAIYTTTGTLDVDDTDFSGNSVSAKYALGGAIHYQNYLSLKNGSISGNSAVSQGTQAYGGAVYANHSSSAPKSVFENLTFESNSASGLGTTAGGGVYNASTGAMDFNGVTFSKNSAISDDSSAYGGAMYNYRGAVSFEDSDFAENKIEGVIAMGGAVFSGAEMSFDGSDFTDNSAKGSMWGYGGAISSNSSLTIDNSSFSGNSATSDNVAAGGAINNASSAVISNTSFSNNSVTGDTAWGGAIYNASELTLNDVSFTGNTVTGTSEALGGAIYNAGTVSMNVSTGKTISISANTVNGNANSIYFFEAGTLNVNTAAGGVLYMGDAMKGVNTFEGETFEINKTGTGSWNLGGPNSFTVADNSALILNISQGTLAIVELSNFEANGALSKMTLSKSAVLDLRGALSVTFSEGTILLESGSTLKFEKYQLSETVSPLFGKTLDLDILSVGEKIMVDISGLEALELNDALLVIGYESYSSEFGTGKDANDYFRLIGGSASEFYFEWRSNGLYLIKGNIPEASTFALIAAFAALALASYKRRR